MGEITLAFISIVSVIILFVFYYILSGKKSNATVINRYTGSRFSEESIEFAGEKSTGILFTGILPFIIFVLILGMHHEKIGLTPGRFTEYWYLYLLLPAVTVPISFYISKSPNIQKRSPQLRIKNWVPGHLLLTAAGWIIYIFGYEFLFRGVLWFLVYGAFGFWPALIINIFLYSLVHLPQGKLMTAGAIPIGLIFCFLSHLTGSFFPSFLIHTSMSVSTEFSSLYHNPEFHFQSSAS